MRQAVGRFLDCGWLENGFARVRCPECRAEFLVAFRCKGRLFCPSCHARRLAEVAHRQVVYRTLREYVQAGLGERDAVPGVFGACRASARSYTGTRTGSR